MSEEKRLMKELRSQGQEGEDYSDVLSEYEMLVLPNPKEAAEARRRRRDMANNPQDAKKIMEAQRAQAGDPGNVAVVNQPQNMKGPKTPVPTIPKTTRPDPGEALSNDMLATLQHNQLALHNEYDRLRQAVTNEFEHTRLLIQNNGQNSQAFGVLVEKINVLLYVTYHVMGKLNITPKDINLEEAHLAQISDLG